MSAHTYWWIALVLGLIVAVVAVALLQVFLNQVHRIERGSGAVWQAGKEVARNTATTWLLAETSARLGELTEEAGRHGQLLRGEGAPAGAPPSGEDRATTASQSAGGAR